MKKEKKEASRPRVGNKREEWVGEESKGGDSREEMKRGGEGRGEERGGEGEGTIEERRERREDKRKERVNARNRTSTR